MPITYRRSREKANYPFLVEFKPTENWGTHSAHMTREEATGEALKLAAKYPALPVRVHHCAGGPITR